MIDPSWGANPRQATETVQMLVQAPAPSLGPATLHILLISPSYAAVCYEIRRPRVYNNVHFLDTLHYVTLFKQSVCQDISGIRVKGVDGIGSIPSQDRLFTTQMCSHRL